jgi:hypothetical protein
MHVELSIHVKMVVHAKHYQVDDTIAFVHKIITEKLARIVSQFFSLVFYYIKFFV